MTRNKGDAVTALFRKKSDGAAAERQAADHLTAAGLVLVERNYRSRHGEIDLIMEQDDTLVFVEVRVRSRTDYGTPAESVDRRKQSKLRATAEVYLQLHPRRSNHPCRFDIVAITTAPDGDRIEWLRNAF